MSKIFDAFVNVVHTQTNTSFSFELEDLHALLISFIVCEDDFKGSWLVDNKVGSFVLITKGMSSNNNGFFPSWNQSWDVADNDGFSEDSTVENVSDATVGANPHVFEIKLLDSSFIRSYCGALNTDLTFLDSIGSVNGDLVVGCVSVFNSEVEIQDVEIKERKDQLILNWFPDDSGHFITVKLSDWVRDFDFIKLHQMNQKYLIYITIKILQLSLLFEIVIHLFHFRFFKI